jgi:hypothetical protein
MRDTKKRLAELCQPYMRRAQMLGGYASPAKLAEAMGMSRALLYRAARGLGPEWRVMKLMERGGITPEHRAEVGYLLGLWGYGQRGGEP